VFVATSINGIVGWTALVVGLVASAFGALSLVGATLRGDTRPLRSAHRYGWVVFASAAVAIGIMIRALVVRDFELEYVQQVGSYDTPTLFNLTAVWSALEGSILLWLVVLAGYTAVLVHRYRRRLDDALVAWAMVTMFVVTLFFFFLAMGPLEVFQEGPPLDLTRCCAGPNPLLQNHILVVFHPPTLYLGYVGFTVPFAFAVGALVTGRVGEGWLLETRRWALYAWGLLSMGILLGGWWAYEVLGWGGVWGWDPVENASLLPWLTGTAYIHSVLVQERRGMLRVWNLSLLVATFSLTILGTFLTRSGVIASVHAFSNGAVGPYLLGFFGVIVVVSLALIAWRGDRLRSPGSIDSVVSREGAFLLNNVLFALFAFVVLLGTVFPLVVEALQNRQTAVGSPYFNRMTTPIGLVLLFLMAVAPALPWRVGTAEVLSQRLFWPAVGGVVAMVVSLLLGGDGVTPMLAFGLAGFAAGGALRQLVLATRRQGWRGLVGRVNGGMVVHLGVILIAVVLAASNSYARRAEFTLNVGDTVRFESHTFTLLSIDQFSDARSVGFKTPVSIDGGQAYAPARTRFTGSGSLVGTPSVKTGLAGDIYLTLEQATPSDNSATIKVTLKPMMLYMWLGGALLAVGTLLSAFPGKRRNPTAPASAIGEPSTEARSPADSPLVEVSNG
jgi:cytochrome c-type biogenesis protein CcmF